MSDLRKHFEHYLKCKKYKESTIQQYVCRVNKICNLLYNQSWDWDRLAYDLVSLLMYCTEYANKEYYISQDNFDLITAHFQTINAFLEQENFEKRRFGVQDTEYQTDLTIYLNVNHKETPLATIKSSQMIEYLDLIGLVLNNRNIFQQGSFEDALFMFRKSPSSRFFMKSDPSLRIFRLIYDQISQADGDGPIWFYVAYHKEELFTHKNILLLFYQSIKENPTDFNEEMLKFVSQGIGELLSYQNSFNQNVLSLIYSSSLGDKPTQLYAESKDHPKGILVKQLTELFRVNSRTIRNLKGLQPIAPHSRYYSIDDINEHLINQHVNVKMPYECVDYKMAYSEKNWCYMQEALQELDVSRSLLGKMKKNNLLTYIQNTSRTTLYYVPELKALQKIHEEVKNQHRFCPQKCINELFTKKLKEMQGLVKYTS